MLKLIFLSTFFCCTQINKKWIPNELQGKLPVPEPNSKSFIPSIEYKKALQHFFAGDI